MGQHKHNPTAIAAKNGEIKPQKRIAKSERKRVLEAAVKAVLYSKVPPINIIPKYK